ncbi:MAG: flippase-like domain-containing protein [Gemmatimonadetes bacterium]|nr:flippase-like domain-containing protein [Gemmatimonadota bacterium]
MSEPSTASSARDAAIGSVRADRRAWALWVQTAISLALGAVLLLVVDWSELYASLAGTRPLWIAAGFFLLALQYPVTAIKWRASLEAHGLRWPLLRLCRIVAGAAFFNNFLPSSIGGDGYRVARTWPESAPKSRALSAVVVERLLGLGALVFLGLIGAVWVAVRQDAPTARLYVLGSVLALLVGSVGLVSVRSALRDRIAAAIRERPKFAALARNVALVRAARGPMMRLVVHSFVFHFIAVLAVYFILGALGATTGYWSVALVVAVSGLAAALPISLNGLGVQEGSFAFVAAQLGVPFDSALAAAVVVRVLVLPLTLIGGAVHLADLHVTDPEQPIDELAEAAPVADESRPAARATPSRR